MCLERWDGEEMCCIKLKESKRSKNLWAVGFEGTLMWKLKSPTTMLKRVFLPTDILSLLLGLLISRKPCLHEGTTGKIFSLNKVTDLAWLHVITLRIPGDRLRMVVWDGNHKGDGIDAQISLVKVVVDWRLGGRIIGQAGSPWGTNSPLLMTSGGQRTGDPTL